MANSFHIQAHHMQAALPRHCCNKLLLTHQHVSSTACHQQCLVRPLTVPQPPRQALQPRRIVSGIHSVNWLVTCVRSSVTSEHAAGITSSSSSASSTLRGRYRRTSRRTVSSAPTENGAGTEPPPSVQQQSSVLAGPVEQQQQASGSSMYGMPPLGTLLLQQDDQLQHQLQLGFAILSQPRPAAYPTGADSSTAEQLPRPPLQQQQQQQQASHGTQPPALTAQRATTRSVPLAPPAAADLPRCMRYTDYAVQASATSEAAAAFGADQVDSLHEIAAAAAGAAKAAAHAEARVRRRSFAVSPGVPSTVVAAAYTDVALLEAAPRTRRRRASTTSSSSCDSIANSGSSSSSSSSKASSGGKKATAIGSSCSRIRSGSSRGSTKPSNGSNTAASSSKAGAGAMMPPSPAAAKVDPGTAAAVSSTTGRKSHAPSPSRTATPAALNQQQQQPPSLLPSQQQQQQPSSSLPVQQRQQQQPSSPLPLPVQQRQQQQQQGERQDEQQVLLELQELLANEGIQLPELRFGQHRTLCPACQGGSSNEDCFALNLSEAGSAVWMCHRATCGYKGRVAVRRDRRRSRSSSSSSSDGGNSQTGVATVAKEQEAAAVPADTSRLRPLSRKLLAWLQSRGISQAVLARNKVMMGSRYCKSLGAWVDHVAFPFYSGGHVVNIKYRALPKHFQQSAKGQQVFYGLDDIQGSPAVLIVEGELDKLSVEEATGATAILSVPAGASAPPASASHQQQQQQYVSSTPYSRTNSSSGQSFSEGDRKYAYVQQALPLLQHCRNIVIGVDADPAGWHTAQQLADRLGRQRCLYLAWPAAGEPGVDALQRVASVAAAQGMLVDVAAGLACKDANDVLMCYGKQVLAMYVKTGPVPFPLH